MEVKPIVFGEDLGFCRNIFKDGKKPDKAEFTRLWIEMINQIERNKAARSTK